ncbi:sulfite exporter TauE/SafE family protein [Mastigocoleus sp. MO_188.B34]|uniref:sulfite exporter TauE/SafE family protein n=1 Tax=Mastigocoleus sp. MO_188.B34 TaxID=3036635 RepID=UPI002634968F|nr:sulfite exporter TauE/SafE family protein [Mastigocoleus sp. MO_188.B34]MDJ0694663.1 sulfite exporter TauE/SafE family protein [Mastigocoleus sp. MO_188.B34]
MSLLLLKSWLILLGGGLLSGILAGFLGIGGGTILVPLQKALGFTTIEAVATSSLAIVITATSGSIQNWRMGFISLKQVLYLGLPALFTAQLGVFLANIIPEFVLLICFGLLLLANIYLVQLRKRLKKANSKNIKQEVKVTHSQIRYPENSQSEITQIEAINSQTISSEARRSKGVKLKTNPAVARLITGGLAGTLAGLFGIGGGVIMVPLQMLLLEETIKIAIQNSLGVIVITAISASIGHGMSGNILFSQGLILGFGGLLGAQISTRFLPKFSDKVISIYFRILLVSLSIYMFWQALEVYKYQQIKDTFI